jgi:hypothetical protein
LQRTCSSHSPLRETSSSDWAPHNPLIQFHSRLLIIIFRTKSFAAFSDLSEPLGARRFLTDAAHNTFRHQLLQLQVACCWGGNCAPQCEPPRRRVWPVAPRPAPNKSPRMNYRVLLGLEEKFPPNRPHPAHFGSFQGRNGQLALCASPAPGMVTLHTYRQESALQPQLFATPAAVEGGNIGWCLAEKCLCRARDEDSPCINTGRERVWDLRKVV